MPGSPLLTPLLRSPSLALLAPGPPRYFRVHANGYPPAAIFFHYRALIGNILNGRTIGGLLSSLLAGRVAPPLPSLQVCDLLYPLV
jgi:hypothetical protein